MHNGSLISVQCNETQSKYYSINVALRKLVYHIYKSKLFGRTYLFDYSVLYWFIMGAATLNKQQLINEIFRISTYDSSYQEDVKNKLAKAGFYCKIDKKVECFTCGFELDTVNLCPDEDVIKLHKEKQPTCTFAQKLESNNASTLDNIESNNASALDEIESNNASALDEIESNNASALDKNQNVRSKKFLSYDSLRYERERLQTFIDWHIVWLSPEALAADGFYYLRTYDHCACVFCRGIVGAWEVGDTPRGEHQRHFPHCPFIRGQPVGNVPISQSDILDRLPLDGEECPIPPPRCDFTTDQTGTGTERHMPGSYPEARVPARKNKVNFDNIGLPKYSGPKRKDYITKESRLKSYSKWPERVKQTPNEMAEAGFFYCGLSDHVRCFHCGNGLRNWETNDKPWNEHARWYPDCNFVLLSKGQEFIDKVRRENPPFMRSIASKDGKPQKAVASSGRFKPVTESDLEPLMKLDIMQAVSGMGFPASAIKKALRRKLEQTGLPFFTLEPCIEAVLQLMEEETRQTLQESTNSEVESEARDRQNDKIQALSNQSPSNSAEAASADSHPTIVVAGPSRYADLRPASPNASGSSSPPSDASGSSSPPSDASCTPSPSASGIVGSPPQILATPAESIETPSLGINPVPSDTFVEGPSQTNSATEAMEIDEPTETMDTVTETTPRPTVMESQTLDAFREADEVMSAAENILKPAQSGPSSLDKNNEGTTPMAVTLQEQAPSSAVKSPSSAVSKSSSDDIAAELERIRESRMCKICMDAEMNVVFLPCQHMATCSGCAVTMANCPICRVDIKYTIKPIFS